jgi:hypothetical protein
MNFTTFLIESNNITSDEVALHDNVPKEITALMKVKDASKYKAIYAGNTPVGAIKITRTKSGGYQIGSIFIVADYNKNNYAEKAIKLGIGKKPAQTLIAAYDKASKILFSNLGFKHTSNKEHNGEMLELWNR